MIENSFDSMWQILRTEDLAWKEHWIKETQVLMTVHFKKQSNSISHYFGWWSLANGILSSPAFFQPNGFNIIQVYDSRRPFSIDQPPDQTTEACVFFLFCQALQANKVDPYKIALKEKYLRDRNSKEHLIALYQLGVWEGVVTPENWDYHTLSMLWKALRFHEWYRLANTVLKLLENICNKTTESKETLTTNLSSQ